MVLVVRYAPIAQGKERWPPEPGAQVRILVGAFPFYATTELIIQKQPPEAISDGYLSSFCEVIFKIILGS
jgi:hypothetical protein